MRNFRHTFGAMLDRAIIRGAHPFEVADWGLSAVIVAPHPDDETLGCGGVASKKLHRGVDVRFVFVTDGAASHSDHVEPQALRTVREREAIEAVRRLGGSPDRVTFLRVPDGAARTHVGAIANALAPLFVAWQPQSVFVTHAKEPPSDHVAVNLGTRQALRIYGRHVSLFEYPVWYWHQWPWVSLHSQVPGLHRAALRQTLRTLAGLRGIGLFNCVVDVGDMIDVKRHALMSHRSQVERPAGLDSWPVLGDIGGGDFLGRLLGNHEMFTRYELNA
ncbi:PIG-L deacetylase family protein [Mesorhizobium sp. B263B2A]|uniref:PIG-L deacetylase family protein n=1 Tax=Mesorhizobium sp. B263B2A TaxID=2876669 RepID=UPI001CD13AFE|nr:PIG-L deacetylase family protein [Mesorhizobium sp. B263B2A]MCA0030279.1 PIG-L family deacetylase [Mesorhizobium sp. B263B2A]